jgi:asparagine synthetase B (glutamine-hydrolysing)
MFLVAVTKDGVTGNFPSGKVDEFSLRSFKVTVVTDRFLSDVIAQENGFSVVESPLLFTSDFQKVIFSQVTVDDKRDRLVVFKSTISGRPIYYHINKKGEFFCSTHISLLRAAGVAIEENREVLPEFFVFRFVIPPNTIYKNIHQLLSGDQLTIKLTNEKWDLSNIDNYIPPKPELNTGVEEISKKTLTLLNKSINVLDPVHTKLSILLSGGLDSSILYKICQTTFHTDRTFSTSFPFEDPQNDLEKEYSLSAANHFKTNHQYFEMTTEEYLTGLLESIHNAEVPVHHLQSVPIFLLSKQIPEKNNIVVSGLGADDIFGTSIQYELFQTDRKILYKFLAKYQTNHIIRSVIHLNKRLQRLSKDLEKYNRSKLPVTDSNHLLWSLGAYGSEEWAEQYFNTSREEIIKNRCTVIEKFLDRSIYDAISMLLFFGSATTTQAIWAKLAESKQKIFYYPFSDIELVNFVFSIPWNIKLAQPKSILRIVARQIEIPETIIDRPKSGFGVQPKLWAEQNGVFEALVPLASKVIDIKEIRNMQSLDLKKAMTYWNMLNYAIWKRLCINNESLNVLMEELE